VNIRAVWSRPRSRRSVLQRCTLTGTHFVARSANKTVGILTIIMPRVVPATTAANASYLAAKASAMIGLRKLYFTDNSREPQRLDRLGQYLLHKTSHVCANETWANHQLFTGTSSQRLRPFFSGTGRYQRYAGRRLVVICARDGLKNIRLTNDSSAVVLESADRRPIHKNKTRSSRRLLASTIFCTGCIHKNTDTHPSA
jgi:hypothetical protein